MEKHKHGGDIYHHPGCLDFSANCNPLGTPGSVKEAIKESSERIHFYPQVGYQPLREAIAEWEGVPSSWVICSNGAAELIFSLCFAKRFQNAVVAAPTFAEYEQALTGCGCQVKRHALNPDTFCVTEKILEELARDVDALFLCNPNNPTGILTDRELLRKILQICREKHIFLVLDECFLDFVKEPEKFTMKGYLKKYPNLLILKAFTKRYAMAGVRLGYGLTANVHLLEKIGQVTQPWNISSLANDAGIAALKEKDYVEEGRRMVFEQAVYLKETLKKLGLRVYDSQANYIFFYGPENLWEECEKRGILIRDCSNYPGLSRGYFRIAVRKPEENQKLTEVLTEILKETREEGQGR